MNCDFLRRHLDAYVDGEVDPTTQIEFERHLQVCAGCQEMLAFTRELKVRVRDSVRGVRAPTGLRQRICSALDCAERGPADEARARSQRAPLVRLVPMRARYTVALAAAAVLALAYAGTMPGDDGASTRATTMPVFEDVVQLHSLEVPPDVRGEQPQDVVTYFRDKVRFPVRPAEFDRGDAQLVGARLSNVRDRRAGVLYYDVGGRRVTVVVFDPPGGVENGALRTRLLGRELYYHQVRGYTVPVRRQDGVTYAFTGDLDRRSLLRLAATARVRY